MAYTKSQMLYDDGRYYKWKASEDADNPYYRGGSDRAQLNREEGYEVLYFINHIVAKHWPLNVSLATYHKVERMIRYSVPSGIRKRESVADWIVKNWGLVGY